MTDLISQAFGFKQWADRRTLDAAAQIDVSRFSDQIALIRQQLNHLVIVQELFAARLGSQPEPHGATNTAEVPGFEALQERYLASNKWYEQFITNRDLTTDDRILSFEFTDGKQGAMSQLEILFHIINHASYHRGTIARALDLAQVPHPADIFTMYLHDVEPSRRLKEKEL